MTVRRRRPSGPAIPEKYARFQRDEWPPNLSSEEAVQFWHQARSVWHEQHGWREGETVVSPLGDWLTLLREKRQAWLRTCCTEPAEAGNGHQGG